MKKRKPTKQAVKKGNVLRQNVNKEFVVGEYNLKNIGIFSELILYKQALLMVCAWAVTIVLLCQIRALRPDTGAQVVDVSPSFKFYKKIITGQVGQAVGTLIVAYDAILYLDSDPDKLNTQLVNLLDNNTGTAKYIERVTKDNWTLYILGGVARFIGLGNSCPCSNYKVFGIENPLGLKIQDILDLIDVPNKPSVEDVTIFLQNKFYDVDSGVRTGITFDENEIGDKGHAPLELEIFGPDKVPSRVISLKSRSSVLGADGSIPGNAISRDDLKAHLSPIELVRYDQAARAGEKKLLQGLNQKVIDKIKAAEQKLTSTNSGGQQDTSVPEPQPGPVEAEALPTELAGGYIDLNSNKNNLLRVDNAKTNQIPPVRPIPSVNNPSIGNERSIPPQSPPGGRGNQGRQNPNRPQRN